MTQTTGRITPSDFLQAGDVEGWRVLGDGANAYFPTHSLAESARFVQAIGELPGVDDHPPALDIRDGGVTVRLVPFWFEAMDEPRPGGGGAIHVAVWVPYDQAQARIDAALAAGGRIVRDQFAPSWVTLADAAGNEVDVATTSGRA